MAAPIYYRWDDDNAPVSRGERTSLVEILRACLVDGYGTKPAAGFTLEYINAGGDVAAFRNNSVTGTGFYLQVDGVRHATAGNHYIAGFETMSDEANGLGPFSTVDLFIATGPAGTTARPWVLIADDRFFWFICWENITTPPLKITKADSGMIFGDIVAYYPTDYFACVVGGTSSLGIPVGIKAGGTAGGTCSSYLASMPRDSDGVPGPKGYPMIRGGGPSSETIMGFQGMPYTPGDPIMYTRPHLGNTLGYSIRGWMPGQYYPCHEDAFDQLEEVVTAPNGNMLSVCSLECSNSNCNIFISLEDWRT